MKQYKAIFKLAALAASTLALAGLSARAATVWNVNFGTGITTGDNYVGAAAENTANSTWNAITAVGTSALADSIGSATSVTISLTPGTGSVLDFGSRALTTGDKIFTTFLKDGDGDGAGTGDIVNDDPYTVSFGNLAAGTYALVVYSDWFWGNSRGVPVTQTAGSGLSGTFIVNSEGSGQVNGSVGPLLEDTDPGRVNSPTTLQTNYARLDGLSPDINGNLTFTMGGANATDGNAPLNGFQLVLIPEPSTALMLGLAGLLLARRRR